MSEVTQEQRPQSRFRLAKVETPGAKLPPIARPLEQPVALEPATIPVKSFESDLTVFAVPLESTELAAVELDIGGLAEEVIAQAKESSTGLEEALPPAAGPLPLDAALTAPPLTKAHPIAEFAVVPFGPPTPSVPTAELGTLRARYAKGPNPAAKPAAPAPEAQKPKPAEPAKEAAPVKPAEPAKPADAAKPAEPVKPAKPTEPIKTEAAKSAEPAKPAEAAKPAEPQPKPKISIRPVEPAKPVRQEIRRPTTMVARSSSAAAAAQASPEPAPDTASAPAATEPKVIPIRKAEPASTPIPVEEPLPTLGMSTASVGGTSMGMKIGIAAAVLVVLGGAGYYFKRGDATAKADAGQTTATASDLAQPLPSLGGAGWTTNWGGDAAVNRGKQISLYRPTMVISDYRIEIHGQIERKAMGWIFRARDPKNYYVMKLEWIKGGVEPVPALIKYAVIDGKESTHTQVLLPLDNISLTTLFKVRTDVKGNRFTTYINDKPVDYWTDDNVKLGGAGLYSEPGERAIIKTTNIAALR